MSDELFVDSGKKGVGDFSRHRGQRILRDDEGREFYGVPELKQHDVGVGDRYHEIKPEEKGRLDLIAFQYYGTPELDWLLASINELAHPIRDATSGVVLLIPSLETLYGTILRG